MSGDQQRCMSTKKRLILWPLDRQINTPKQTPWLETESDQLCMPSSTNLGFPIGRSRNIGTLFFYFSIFVLHSKQAFCGLNSTIFSYTQPEPFLYQVSHHLTQLPMHYTPLLICFLMIWRLLQLHTNVYISAVGICAVWVDLDVCIFFWMGVWVFLGIIRTLY